MDIFGIFLLPVDDPPSFFSSSFLSSSFPFSSSISSHFKSEPCYVAQVSLGLTIVVHPALNLLSRYLGPLSAGLPGMRTMGGDQSSVFCHLQEHSHLLLGPTGLCPAPPFIGYFSPSSLAPLFPVEPQLHLSGLLLIMELCYHGRGPRAEGLPARLHSTALWRGRTLLPKQPFPRC